MRVLRTFFLVLVLGVAVLGVADPASAQNDEGCALCGGGGVGGDGGSVFAGVGVGGTITVSGSGDGCTYWIDGLGHEYFLPGEEHDANKSEELWVVVAWDCDNDGLIDGSRLVQIVTPVDVAREAFARVEELLPTQDIVLMLPTPVSQSWTPLTVGTGSDYYNFNPMSWEPVSATATVGGLTVTTTATPLRVEWDTGNLNSSTGHGDLRYVTCEGPGDIPWNPQDASCRAWYMTSSAGQVDLTGTPDRVSLLATVYWQISFTSNIGFDNPTWFVHETTTQRDQIPVVETQSIIIK